MITDVLDAIQKFMNSPATDLATGAVVGGIVWRVFERFGSILNESSNKVVTTWLSEANTVTSLRKWSDVPRKMFRFLFGNAQLSWECLLRSSVVSVPATMVSFVLHSSDLEYYGGTQNGFSLLFLWEFVLVFAVPCGFLAVLVTRRILRYLPYVKSSGGIMYVLLLDMFAKAMLVAIPTVVLCIIAAITSVSTTRQSGPYSRFDVTQMVGDVLWFGSMPGQVSC